MSEKPPYVITDKIVNLVANISAMIPFIAPNINVHLRKDRNIRSVYSSLAIENNTLSLEQVSDVIHGKRVIGSPSEIQEVKNAFKAYSHIERFQPFSISDFCKAHYLMMNDLMDNAGVFRNKGVGIYDGDTLIHAAPKAEFVRKHIEHLFNWAKSSEVHPLVKSSVVHYEIEFIHPFMDGNGRMGRLWQTVLLSNWESLFLSIPIETIIYERQQEYYSVLRKSDIAGNSTIFIEFILTAVADVLSLQKKHQHEPIDKHQVEEYLPDCKKEMIQILDALRNKPLSRKDIFSFIGKSGDSRAFKRYIQPLIMKGLIEMTIPDKPNSKLQKYRLTSKGNKLVK